MTDPNSLLAGGSAILVGSAIVSSAALKAWRGWLELKRLELAGGGGDRTRPAPRGELAELKERVLKLEAIAAGVDF